MTPEVPDLSGVNEQYLYLHAVYPLPDTEWCEIEIDMHIKSGEKEICFVGGADIYFFPSIWNEDGTWEKDLTNRPIALETQKRALNGFLPSSLIGLLNEATWEDVGLTDDQIESLHSLSDSRFKDSKEIEWKDNFYGQFLFDDSDLHHFIIHDYNYNNYHLKNLRSLDISTGYNSNRIRSIGYVITKED